eukprot:m.233980 g.233980  ORF g.233980 m.233980 type:complete len:122 (+) comp15251_c1_seq1:111-476(+)
MSSAQGVVTAATGPYLEKGRTVKGEPVPAQFHFHWDNAIWAHVEPNDGDIVVASAYKSGTTWTQNIALKIMGQDIETNLNDVFPWIDMDPCDKIVRFFLLPSFLSSLSSVSFVSSLHFTTL